MNYKALNKGNPINIMDLLPETTIKNETQEETSFQEIKIKTIALPEHVIEWRRYLINQKFSLDTVSSYYSVIKNFVGYRIFVSQKNIDSFREEHMNTVGSSALKSFIKFLVYKKGFSQDLLNIRFEKNRGKRKLPKTISPDDVEKVIGGMESVKDKLMVQTIFSLALRVEETIKIRWEDFNWAEWLKDQNQYGKVKLKNTKGGRFRVLPVNPVLMRDLYNHHPKRTEAGIPIGGLVFGDDQVIMGYIAEKPEHEDLSREQRIDINRKHYLINTKKLFRDRLIKASKKSIGQAITPHVLRHAKAQFLLDSGVSLESIQGLLGHASIATTQIYAKASPEKIKADLQKFDVPGKEIDQIRSSNE